MHDAELEELRRRKMAQLQQSQESQLQQQAMMEERAKQMEAERQAIMRQILTPEARERLAKVKMAYPDVAATAAPPHADGAYPKSNRRCYSESDSKTDFASEA